MSDTGATSSNEPCVLCNVGGLLLEGPAWDARGSRVLLADIHRPELLSYAWPSGEVTRVPASETCSAWLPRQDGGSVVAYRSGVELFDEDGAAVARVPVEADIPANRSNDATCDPVGRLWVGTMADDESACAGALYRIDRDRGATRVISPVSISNGLGWSPDGSRMYYIDSPTRRIDVFDYDLETGEPAYRRLFADVSGLPGIPDGLAVDAEGCLWVAFYDGGAVHRFAPDGAHVGQLSLPVLRPTSCAFVSESLDRLVITSARAPDGSGGELYVHSPGVTGLPVAAYRD
jgi:sugar lactone lactonase YvrE